MLNQAPLETGACNKDFARFSKVEVGYDSCKSSRSSTATGREAMRTPLPSESKDPNSRVRLKRSIGLYIGIYVDYMRVQGPK